MLAKHYPQSPVIEALHCNQFPELIAGITCPEDPVNDNCNPVFREGLAQRLLDRQDRLALVQERLLTVGGTLDERTAREATVAARKAELETILAGVPETNVIRIDALTARIANLEERLTTLAAAIERLNNICDDPNNPPPNK